MKPIRDVSRICGVAGLMLLLAASGAFAGTRIEKRLKLAPGGMLSVDTAAGSVTIRGGASDEAHVVITSSDDDLEKRFRFEFREESGAVRIRARRVASLVFEGEAPRFEIEVPTVTNVEVDTAGGSIGVHDLEGNADLDTSGGSIRVGRLKGTLAAETSGGAISIDAVSGSAEISTSGGSIEADGILGTLDAVTSGGSILVGKVDGDARLETSGGSIRVASAGGSVHAESSAGAIDVAFARGNAKGGSLSTSAGGIRVALDGSIGLNVDASTSVGSIRTDLPFRVSGERVDSLFSGSLNQGGATLLLRTSAGSIQIERAE